MVSLCQLPIIGQMAGMCGRWWYFPAGAAVPPAALILRPGDLPDMATDVVQPPFADHAHRIRITVPCPPPHDIGQLADV